MSGIFSYVKTAGLAAALLCGTAVFYNSAQAHDYSQTAIRSAQQQLKSQGYYNGSVDGIDGPMTRSAIRNYQSQNNLAVNGRLDHETRSSLGVATSGEANRSAVESSATPAPSSPTISASQRCLQQKGFYKGDIDGNMGPETQAAIREYQKNSNLNVTGRLDQATLSSLGVSK